MCPRSPTRTTQAAATYAQVSKRSLVPAVVEPGAEYFTGTVKSFNDRRGFGFLLCEETFARWNRDVYLSKVEAEVAIIKGEEMLKEGDNVCFAVVLSEEGHPKAAGVQRLRGTNLQCSAQVGDKAGKMMRTNMPTVQSNLQGKSDVTAQVGDRNKILEEQVQTFASGCGTEFSFPADLSSDERKFVKKVADRLGLPSQSLGMGSERRIHIFRPSPSSAILTSSVPQIQPSGLVPVEYLVKNTFIDGHVDQIQPQEGPQSQSMPADTFHECLVAEAASFAKVAPMDCLGTVDESPSACIDIQSDARFGMESPDSVRERYSFKNTFIHFEEDGSKENMDERIIQSMPAGMFAEGLEKDKAAATASMARTALRPQALCEQALHSEAAEDTMFPDTPNADTARCDALSLAAMNGSEFGWPPAAPTSVPTIAQGPVPMPQAWWAPAAPAPATWPAMTSVVVVGLLNQPGFNGLRGIINSFDAETGRYNVQLDMGSGKQRMAKLKSENLVPQGQTVIPDVAQPLPSVSPDVAQVVPLLPSHCKPRLMLDELVA